ncbi:MAG: MOSC domain-containing protein [Gaiellaceae bacterium]
MPEVSWLSIAPVKGLALQHPGEVMLHRHGVTENRRFYIVDEEGLRFGLLRRGGLVTVGVEYDAHEERLALRFPDGVAVEGRIALDGEVTTDFYGREVQGRVVVGPWSRALSEQFGRSLRLVQSERPGAAVDRGGRGGVTLVSDASVDELERQAGAEVDARRFRMLVGVGGCEPHEEDGWLGGDVRIGEALVRLVGRVGRCAITTQNPATGVPNLDTLRTIKGYRGLSDERSIDFGVFGEVVEPGRVRVGDPVAPRWR